MAYLTNLYDTSRCTACRGCQVACKNWNQLPAVIEPFQGNYQTHKDTNGDTYTIVKMIETEDPVDGVIWNFLKYQCMHCFEPACMKVCPRGRIRKQTGVPLFMTPINVLGVSTAPMLVLSKYPNIGNEKIKLLNAPCVLIVWKKACSLLALQPVLQVLSCLVIGMNCSSMQKIV